MSLNQCQFIGNLGRDPETRTFNNDSKVCNLRLAVSETWKDRNSGERREKTEWVSVAVFGPLANICEQYLRKGSKVFVSGKLTTRKWQDQNGQDRYSTEVVLQGPQAIMTMLDGQPGGGQREQQRGGYDQSPEGYGSGGRPSNDAFDSEIPFTCEWRI